MPVTVTYYDTAMALIEIGSVRLLTDPVFDPEGTTFDDGPVRLEKTGGCSVAPEELGRIDAVLLSHHQHGDNLDNAGRAFLGTVAKVLTTPWSASQLAGVPAQGLETWTQTTVTAPDGGAVSVTAVPAQHGPDGTQQATGPVTGFLLDWPGRQAGPLYVSGDTVRFAGTDEIAKRYAPIGLALLNLGRAGVAPLGEAELTLSAQEAAEYAKLLQAEWIAPLHFEGWRHFREDRQAAVQVFRQSDVATRVRWLTPRVPQAFDL